MKLKSVITAIAAGTILSSTSFAYQTSQSGAGGVAAAGPNGAVAGGGAASKAEAQKQRKMRKHKKSGDGQHQTSARRACVPGTASTSTSGAVYTDRNSGSAGMTTSGTASGDGTVRASSEGDVYSSTDQHGSTAEGYGNSTAVAREPTSRPC